MKLYRYVSYNKDFLAQIPLACKYGTDTREVVLLMGKAVQEFLVLLHVWQTPDFLFPY